MGGKRKNYDGSFAMIDINFILDDPRLDDLTAADRWVYVALWCIAVRERRETLSEHYGHRSVSRLARVDTRTTQKAITKLQQKCLIEVSQGNLITVIGVKDKHKNLTFKDGDISEDKETIKPPRARVEIEVEEETEVEVEREIEKPHDKRKGILWMLINFTNVESHVQRAIKKYGVEKLHEMIHESFEKGCGVKIGWAEFNEIAFPESNLTPEQKKALAKEKKDKEAVERVKRHEERRAKKENEK